MRDFAKQQGFVAGLCLVLSSVGFAASEERSAEQATKGIMDSIFVSMTHVLPLSLSNKEFRDRKNQERIMADLENLAKNASFLTNHFKQEDRPIFLHLTKSLERDTHEALHFYRNQMYDEARFTLHHLTENCVSCHTKLRDHEPRFKIPSFFDKLGQAGLEPLELAHYQLMARDFDEALKSYEGEITRPSDYISTKIFGDYFKIAIRVAKDFDRVGRTLDKVQDKDLSTNQRKIVQDWQGSLVEIRNRGLNTKISIQAAEELINLAKNKQWYAQDPAALIYYVTASSILNQLVENQGDKLMKEDLAKAFYLLGSTELVISDSFWLSEMDYYLEAAVRTEPQSAWAKEAYDLLEQQYVLGYSGSSGTHMPADVSSLLKELRELIKQPDKTH
jgi:hypothetical protein